MNRLIHQFLSNDERGRNLIANIGLWAGIVLLAIAVFATFALK